MKGAAISSGKLIDDEYLKLNNIDPPIDMCHVTL